MFIQKVILCLELAYGVELEWATIFRPLGGPLGGPKLSKKYSFFYFTLDRSGRLPWKSDVVFMFLLSRFLTNFLLCEKTFDRIILYFWD